MCGIGGIYSFSGAPVSRERLAAISSVLKYRGPDGEGTFTANEVGLVHRRLAVLDRTERSSQPSLDSETQSALTFNGQVYNFKELRRTLIQAGDHFNSDGDAEVFLKGLLRYGIAFIDRVDGDFAIGFWDGRTRTLTLARDRFGVKPLYYALNTKEIIFASEIKAVLSVGLSPQLCLGALGEHLRFRYVQGQKTLFEGIHSLAPGELAEISPKGLAKKQYWSIDPHRFQYAHYEEGLEQLGILWDRSVSRRLHADVPLGILLSGGIDSGFIAHSVHQNAHSMTAMTYEVPGALSEINASQEIASSLGFTHQVVPHRDEYFRSLPQIIAALEEPLGDSIVVPGFELFKETRKKMTVVLSGEGADEVFGGYAHQQVLKKFFGLQSMGLKPALSQLARILPSLSPRLLSRMVPYPVQFDKEIIERAKKLLQAKDPGQAYDLARALMSDGEMNGLLVPQIKEELSKNSMGWSEVLLSDLKSWLPNYGLLRVDKLSMVHGLECRVPYLQHEFAEAALAMTLREAGRIYSPAKKVLRDLVSRRCPNQAFAKRKKQPFFLPSEKTPGKEFEKLFGAYLSPEALKKNGVFAPQAVQKLLKGPPSFVQGKKLISILHLQIWMEVFGVGVSKAIE